MPHISLNVTVEDVFHIVPNVMAGMTAQIVVMNITVVSFRSSGAGTHKYIYACTNVLDT